MSLTAREDILHRLRAAEGRFGAGGELDRLTFDEAELFSDYAAGGDLIGQFCANFEKLRGTARVCGGIGEAIAALLELCPAAEDRGVKEEGKFDASTVLMQDNEVIRTIWQAIPADRRDRFVMLTNDQTRRLSNTEFARAGTGVSGCDLLIARSGSIALRSSSAGGRRLSVVPEHHIVIARAEQVSAGLSPWYQQIKNDPDWSYGVLISGPSRTSDIEKILVLGAHGPKRLSAIIIR